MVERSHSWLNRNRGPLIRWAKKPENHRAFHHLAFGVIAFRAAGAGGLPSEALKPNLTSGVRHALS